MVEVDKKRSKHLINAKLLIRSCSQEERKTILEERKTISGKLQNLHVSDIFYLHISDVFALPIIVCKIYR